MRRKVKRQVSGVKMANQFMLGMALFVVLLSSMLIIMLRSGAVGQEREVLGKKVDVPGSVEQAELDLGGEVKVDLKGDLDTLDQLSSGL
jgi:hypothetical protein